MSPRAIGILAFALALFAAPRLRADGNAKLGVEIDAGLVVPVSTDRLCPSDAHCLFGSGFSLGGIVSRRWGRGLSLGFEYEFWLQNANDVYEVTVSQAFVGVIQQTFRPAQKVRPTLRLRGGLLLLGDSFRVATTGGISEIGAGVEIDVTESTAFTCILAGDILRTGEFTTPNDDVRRAFDGGVDGAIILRLGYLFLL